MFSSVSINEALALDPAGQIPIDVRVAERKMRYFGAGASYSTSEGFGVEGYWGHRNLFGRAEKLRIAGAQGHRGPVTSVQFTPDGKKLVTVGRDRRLLVWELDGDKATRVEDLGSRSGDVAQLGMSPDGQKLLFDEGRELRVLGVKERKILGSLKNAAGAANFSTMALFSPDGKVILTNGAAPGRFSNETLDD